jgi:hypothetical protein
MGRACIMSEVVHEEVRNESDGKSYSVNVAVTFMMT